MRGALRLFLQQIARHVLNIHMNQANDNEENAAGEIDIDKMKRYIAYCKSLASLMSYFGSQKPHALIENVPHVLPPRLRTPSARIS